MKLQRFIPSDSVKLCRKNICIEARGENGRILVGAVCIALLLIGFAAIINATK